MFRREYMEISSKVLTRYRPSPIYIFCLDNYCNYLMTSHWQRGRQWEYWMMRLSPILAMPLPRLIVRIKQTRSHSCRLHLWGPSTLSNVTLGKTCGMTPKRLGRQSAKSPASFSGQGGLGASGFSYAQTNDGPFQHLARCRSVGG
jgi:hypothetical protein